MPFLRYETDGCDSARRYTYAGRVSLAGTRSGALYAGVRSRLSLGACTSWRLSSDDIIASIGHDPWKSAIIIDATPDRRKELNLFRLDYVSGYTYRDWTPVLLHLTVLQNTSSEPDKVAIAKASFECPDGDRVRTFLYLMGGYEEGRWLWGKSGMVNGALLWEDAMTFFTSEISAIP